MEPYTGKSSRGERGANTTNFVIVWPLTALSAEEKNPQWHGEHLSPPPDPRCQISRPTPQKADSPNPDAPSPPVNRKENESNDHEFRYYSYLARYYVGNFRILPDHLDLLLRAIGYQRPTPASSRRPPHQRPRRRPQRDVPDPPHAGPPREAKRAGPRLMSRMLFPRVC